MSVPLLTTKLFAPVVRQNYVSRPRLIQRLEQSLDGALTLISAPPGYGKTTLVVDWLGRSQRAWSWLSLEAEENESGRFFMYLFSAFEKIEPAVGPLVASFQGAQQLPPMQSLITALINELAHTHQDSVLVLDDYHFIHNPEIHSALSFFIDNLPHHFHLVLTTREDPPLPLARMRARGTITEIREQDLRFSIDESAKFLVNTMGLDLSPHIVADLASRTEGWIAGLQMAGLSLQQRDDVEAFTAAFKGDDRYVMDYLLDEVFRQQPAKIQYFLLHTSILDRLCAELCDAVLTDDEGEPQAQPSPGEEHRQAEPGATTSPQAILEYLERANLFIIPLDNRRYWYRYHQLFADLLRYRLERQFKERIPSLQRKASLWWAQAGDPETAMNYAFAAGDLSLAADLAEQFLLQMTGASRLALFESWIRHFPDELIAERAYLCVGCGWVYVLTFQLDLAEKYTHIAESALDSYSPVYSNAEKRWIVRKEVQGNLYAIRSYVSRLQGNNASSIEFAHQALETLPPVALAVRCAVALNLGMLHLDGRQIGAAREALNMAFVEAKKSKGNLYVAVSALSLLGSIEAMQGRLAQAEVYFQRSIQFASEEMGIHTPIPAAGISHGWLVWLHYQRNELGVAQGHMDQVLQAVGPIGQADTTARASLYQALLYIARGEFDAAHDWLLRAEEIMATQFVLGLVRIEGLIFRGLFYLEKGEIESAARLLEAQGIRDGTLVMDPSASERLGGYLLFARVLIAQGENDRAGPLLEQVQARAADLPDFAIYLEALILSAIYMQRKREHKEQAQVLLEKALNLAAPEGYIRPLLNVGNVLVQPLRQAIAQGVQADFASRVLHELAERDRRLAGNVEQPAPGYPAREGVEWIEPLTERERQVLRLLAAGLSSTEIAEQLVISVNTVRSYIKSLYSKLEVHSREQAVERARQHKLL